MAQSTYSLSFNGSDGYVDFGDICDNISEMSISCWAKFNALSSTFRGIITKADGVGASGESYFLSTGGNIDGGGLSSAAQIRFRPNTDTNTADATTKNAYTGTLSTGIWYHFLAHWRSSDGRVRLYLNGVAQTDGTNTGSVIRNTSGSLKFGQSGYGEYLPGLIDDVAIWNNDQTANAAGIAAGTTNIATLTSGLIGLWRLEEGTGTTTTDTSGNSHSGSFIGGVTWSTDIASPLAGGSSIKPWWLYATQQVIGES